MMKFTVLVIALVLAPGLHASVALSRAEITNYPAVFVSQVETRPEILPVFPELRPEVVPELRPEAAQADPCTPCFAHMATLIQELTEATGPQTPELGPEIEILPMPVPEDPPVAPELELRPLPIFPVVPEVEVRPLPIFPEVPEIVQRPAIIPILTNF